MIDKLFWSVVSGAFFYAGIKIGEAVWPTIVDGVVEGWNESQQEN